MGRGRPPGTKNKPGHSAGRPSGSKSKPTHSAGVHGFKHRSSLPPDGNTGERASQAHSDDAMMVDSAIQEDNHTQQAGMLISCRKYFMIMFACNVSCRTVISTWKRRWNSSFPIV